MTESTQPPAEVEAKVEVAVAEEPEPVPDLPVGRPWRRCWPSPSRCCPTQDGTLFYEPKWDGFRCIVFRDGDEVYLGSRNERPFTRYFPELVEAVRAELPDRVRGRRRDRAARSGSQLDFDALQQRIHPAASRVRLLAEQTPASFVAFDLLALGEESLMEAPFSRAAGAAGAIFAGAGASDPADAGHDRRPSRRPSGSRCSRARGSTASSSSRATSRTSRTSA